MGRRKAYSEVAITVKVLAFMLGGRSEGIYYIFNMNK